jgi:hypothetical protein
MRILRRLHSFGQAAMASVTIQAVKKNFGEVPILHGVDIDIADGSSPCWSARRAAASRRCCA